MKQTVKRFTAMHARAIAFTLMLLVLAGGMLLPVTDAAAADKPKWLQTKIASWSIKKSGKVKNSNAAGYCEIHVSINHKNTSSDRIVTALYDKTGSFTLSVLMGIAVRDNVTATLRSTRVNRVSLDPGQSITLKYMLLINKREANASAWSYINDGLLKRGPKIARWSYDVKVKSKGI